MQQLVYEWKRATYGIATNDDVSLEVDGIVMERVQLGLHFARETVDVTHLPSGKRVGGFLSLGAAMEFAHRIAYLLDWSAVAPAFSPDSTAALDSARSAVESSAFRPRTAV